MLSTADFVSSPTKVAMETEGQSSAETAAVEPMQVDTGERGKESAATEGVCNIQLSCTQSMSFHLPKGLPLPPLFWPPSFHSFLPPPFPPSFSLLFSFLFFRSLFTCCLRHNSTLLFQEAYRQLGPSKYHKTLPLRI